MMTDDRAPIALRRDVAQWSEPLLVINPVTDGELARLARGLVVDRSTPESLQAALRRRFPRLVVHRRELSGESVSVWYVYREGRWVSPQAGGSGSRGAGVKAARRD
jgi:hypothetical protein